MNVAALGYYGFGNLGDEAVLAGIRAALKTEAKFDNARFLVLSNDPDRTTGFHPGTVAANRWKWREAAAALTGTDLFILGGGSLLQDVTSVKSVVWYVLMAQIARAKSRRVLWWGQGIGPLKSRVSRVLTRFIASQADAITVRDEKSAALLKGIGVRGSIEVVADPAFALDPEPWREIHGGSGQIIRAEDYGLGGDHLLMAIRSWKTNDFLRQIGYPGFVKSGDARGQLDKQMAVAAGAGCVADFRMFPMEDASLLAMGPVWHWEVGYASIRQIVYVFATARMVVAMRLHALIFAARCAVPFVALSYDPKVDALARASGQEDVLLDVNDTSLTREKLLETITRVRDTDAARRATLREFAAAQGVLAKRPAAIAAGLFS